MSRRGMAVTGGIIAGVVLLGIVAVAAAQPPPQGEQQGQQLLRRLPHGLGAPAMAVGDGAVFVLRDNTLYRFDAQTLELMAQAELPRPKVEPALQAARGDLGAKLFARLDANADGKLAKNEVPEKLRDRLFKADADGNGELTKDELAAARDQLKAARQAQQPPAEQ